MPAEGMPPEKGGKLFRLECSLFGIILTHSRLNKLPQIIYNGINFPTLYIGRV